jgi:hypothetical protein
MILINLVPPDPTFSSPGHGYLERPALQLLFENLKRGEIDNIVVYKVDRLTLRSSQATARSQLCGKTREPWGTVGCAGSLDRVCICNSLKTGN